MHDLTPPDEAAITFEEAPDPTFALRSGVVCWLDLLGLTEQLAQAVRENREPAFVAEYLSVLRPIYKSLEYDFSGTEFQWSAFTDSIVVSVPTDAGHPETTIGLLCDSVAEVQFRLALRGWFARGAVAVGPLHASREFVIGSGMLSAYKLEAGDAVVPRVIVDETVRDALPSFLAYYAAPGESPQNQYFALDDDGQVFINYLFAPISLDCDPATLDDLLAKHRSRILRPPRTACETRQVAGEVSLACSIPQLVLRRVAAWDAGFGFGHRRRPEAPLPQIGACEVRRPHRSQPSMPVGAVMKARPPVGGGGSARSRALRRCRSGFGTWSVLVCMLLDGRG